MQVWTSPFKKDSSRTSSPKCFEICHFVARYWFGELFPGFGHPWHPLNVTKFGWNLVLVTLCFSASWVFDVETIVGCQIITFYPRISKLNSKSSPNQFLATKYQISKHLELLVLLEFFSKREGHTPQNLHYLKP